MEGRGVTEEMAVVEAGDRSWEVASKTMREGDEGRGCAGEMGDPKLDDP